MLYVGKSWTLPPGSAVIETGGFKGSRRVVKRDHLYSLLSTSFGVPDPLCLAEYGMCELSSQYYSQGVAGMLSGPPTGCARDSSTH